jgi:hypothetical protein
MSKAFALTILIASALLLSGGNPKPSSKRQRAATIQASPSAGNNQQSQSNKQAQHVQNIPDTARAVIDLFGDFYSEYQEHATEGDSQYWPPNWSNWALVLVGAVAAYLALRTLRTIGVQAAAVESTDAAKRSADVGERSLTQLERAWVFVMPIKLGDYPALDG